MQCQDRQCTDRLVKLCQAMTRQCRTWQDVIEIMSGENSSVHDTAEHSSAAFINIVACWNSVLDLFFFASKNIRSVTRKYGSTCIGHIRLKVLACEAWELYIAGQQGRAIAGATVQWLSVAKKMIRSSDYVCFAFRWCVMFLEQLFRFELVVWCLASWHGLSRVIWHLIWLLKVVHGTCCIEFLTLASTM